MVFAAVAKKMGRIYTVFTTLEEKLFKQKCLKFYYICQQIIPGPMAFQLLNLFNPAWINMHICLCALSYTTGVNLNPYCTHFLYCPAGQLNWLGFTALFRPLCRVPLGLPVLIEPNWRA